MYARRLQAALLSFAVIALAAPAALAKPAATSPVIVVFHKDVSFAAYRQAYRSDSRMTAHPLRGFAADLTAAQQRALAQEPHVLYIEPDGEMHIVQDQAAATVPQILPWCIDRIDGDLSSAHSGDGTGTVTGVDVYVIDTGIDISNADLNVVSFVNFIDATNNDCSGAGTTSSAIAGVDWVTANAQKPAVANMSVGGTISRALDSAVLQSVASGVTCAIAAGNDGRNVCLSSPARAGYYLGALTTAATDQSDEEASFSKDGRAIQLVYAGYF